MDLIAKSLMGSYAKGPIDPYFEYTTLLLRGDGLNGAQNGRSGPAAAYRDGTFLDSSTNNFTITRNGNTTQGTFSPFSQTGWSYDLNYTTTYLTGADTANLRFNAGNFTIEAWIYLRSYPGAPPAGIVSKGGTNIGWSFRVNQNATLQFLETTTSFNSTATVSLNVWTHVAVVRSGTGSNQTAFYINGVFSNSFTCSTTFNDTGQISIGKGRVISNFFDGFVSNIRLSNTARTILIPTTSLIADVNTIFLSANTNGFKYTDSTGVFTNMTATGTPSVAPFSPFNPTSAWSASTVGGSGYFDGSGDYLSVADNTNLRFGTNAFTIQAWVYRRASGAAHSIIAKGGASTGYVLQVTSTNVLRFTHGTTNVDTTTTIPASAWTHVAAVRTNTSTNGFQLYINGVSSATATVATDFNQTDTLYIGSDRSAANVMNGYISGLKYTNGSAENISVPTGPPTATTNVALLTNFTNAGIYDATAKNVLETVGNAQVSTAQSKWGGSSMSFDGTGDYLLIPDNPSQRIGTGNFTVECWVYRNASGTYGLIGKGTAVTTGWLLSLNSSNQVVFTYGSSTITSAGTVSATTWTHIAVVRSGTGANLTKIYIGGTNDGTGTVSTDFNQTNAMYVAADRTGGSNANAYVQDTRVTLYARYSANFTPPTAAFPVQ